MWHDTKDIPARLTYRDDDDGSARYALVAMLGILGLGIALGFTFRAGQKYELYSPFAKLLMCLAIYGLSAFLLLGALYNAFTRRGITFDSSRRTVTRWDEWLCFKSRVEQPLSSFTAVRISTGEMNYSKSLSTYPVYPVALTQPDGAPFEIQNYYADYALARAMAEKIASHTGLPLNDQSGKAGPKSA